MSAGYQELFMEQGATFNASLTLNDVYGQPYDLTNYTATSQIRKSYYSVNPTATFTVTSDVPINGTINLFLNAAATANVSPGRYVYDVIIRDINNPEFNTIRVLEGIVNVTPSVTR